MFKCNKKYTLSAAVFLSTACIAGMLTGCDFINNKKKSESSVSAQNSAQKFLFSTLEQPPGYTLESTQGYYCRMFAFDGMDYSGKLNRAIAEAIQEAQTMKANGLIGVRFYSVNFEGELLSNADSNASSSAASAPANNSATNKNVIKPVVKSLQSIVKICGDLVQAQEIKK